MNINMNKVWDVLINKAHVAVAVLCQTTIFVMHYRYGKDISTNVQTTVNWFYGFLAGHFGASQVWPDKKSDDTQDNTKS
jgi:hypothetical protein